MKNRIKLKPKPRQYYDWEEIREYLGLKNGDVSRFHYGGSPDNGELIQVYEPDDDDDEQTKEVRNKIIAEFGKCKIHFWW